jgi:HlyD family secretion protein
MLKKSILSIVGVVVLAIAGYFLFLRSAPAKYDFRFDQVSKGDITTTVTATGNINAVVSVDVGTQVSGIISKLYADFNSVVKEGQVIAQIDSTFLVQAVHDAEANLARAQSQLAESKRVLDREKVLVEKRLDPQINLDAALTAYESNSASVKQADATVERAKINLAYSTIYAPIDGVVINRQVNVGQTVAASFSSPTLYTIVNDLRKMQVLATIGEVDIGGISVGQQATFTVDAYPDETFKGMVSQIRLAPVTVQNVVNYTVVIAVNNDRLKLMPGMTANVNVLVASASDVLRVPNMALRFQPSGDLIDTTGAASTNGRRFSHAMGDSGGSENSSGRRGDTQPGMRRRLQDSTSAVPDSVVSIVQVAARPAEQTKFGIVQTFPEFEKRTDAPLAGRGRVWIVSSTGKLKAMPVVTGITDGKYTEVTSHVLKPGDQVVLGVINSTATAGTQTRSPLTGGGQHGPGVPH